jgi:hypothetical protein
VRVTRDMLRHRHYTWPEEAADGNGWELAFRRSQGEHVLAVLQKAADALRLQEPSRLNVLEDLLMRELPDGAVSRHDAFLWLYVEYKKRAYRMGAG